ncbi:MAG: AarF/ABC1/UbiB kinase family protein, partial [Cyanobacteria bacterium KgW148]|nr:AarF/ABC1/UbiB kinase family protein [Cyanobacteria bacterium KgW148]
VARSIDIWRMVLTFFWMIWLDSKDWSYIGGKTPQKIKKRTRDRARWLREALLELGPTFIKVGQLLSTRADILPTESVEELSKLQDSVPAFPYEKTKQIIETELGKPIGEIFPQFEPIPLAAASLGQVHRARLTTGEEVVVKVQRPGLLKLFAIDLGILRKIAQYFTNHPRYGKGRDWLGIYEECRRILYQEADYLNEGKNADTFRRNFRQDDRILTPRIYWRYSTKRVLTLEYLPGIKISDYDQLEAHHLDRKTIARLGAESYLQQLLHHGFFHADPHPGNLAVTPEGRLIFYDFGMMGQIPILTRDKLVRTFFGIAKKDAEAVVNALVELGVLELSGDPGPVRRSVQYMLDNFVGQPLGPQSLTAISDDLYEIAYEQPFRFPAAFTFVLRALSTLEGLGKGLDPDFNFIEIAKPYALNIMENRNGQEIGNFSNGFLGEIGKQAAQMSTSALTLPRKLEDTILKLERGDIRLRVRSQETDRILRKISGIANAIALAILGAAFLLTATALFIAGWRWLALVPLVLALIFVVNTLRLLLRQDKLDRSL